MPNKYNPDFDLHIANKKFRKYIKGFPDSLKIGTNGEQHVNSLLNSDTIKLEVKVDNWTLKAKTPSLALEFWSRGRKSGILLTKSDYYAYVVGLIVLMLPTRFLKYVYRKYHKNAAYVKDVGDVVRGKPSSKIILIKWDEVLNLFKEYRDRNLNRLEAKI